MVDVLVLGVVVVGATFVLLVSGAVLVLDAVSGAAVLLLVSAGTVDVSAGTLLLLLLVVGATLVLDVVSGATVLVLVLDAVSVLGGAPGPVVHGVLLVLDALVLVLDALVCWCVLMLVCSWCRWG